MIPPDFDEPDDEIVPGPETPAVWERRPDESDQAWSLFSRWVLSDAPTIAAFARACPEVSAPTLHALAARGRWRARRAALEAHLHAARVQGAVAEARAQGEAHARATSAALDWATTSILEAQARGVALSPRDAIAYLKTAIELQRLAAGEATSRSSVDLSGATDEQLAAMRAALEAAGVR